MTFEPKGEVGRQVDSSLSEKRKKITPEIVAIDELATFDKAFSMLFARPERRAVVEPYLQQMAEKSPFTHAHSVNVSHMFVTIGRWMGETDEMLVEYAKAGLLHDVGKLDEGIITHVNHEGSLTEEEKKVVNQHPMAGYREFAGREPIVAMVAGMHHKLLNNYPSDDELPLPEEHADLMRIVAITIADQISASGDPRPYRIEPEDPESTIAFLEQTLGEKLGRHKLLIRSAVTLYNNPDFKKARYVVE